MQSPNYGRLSPPPAKRECRATPGYPCRDPTILSTDDSESVTLLRHHSTDLARQFEHSNRRNPRPKSEQAELDYARMTMQNDAYLAAQGDGDLQWSDIGLVSSGGHQVKEEEL